MKCFIDEYDKYKIEYNHAKRSLVKKKKTTITNVKMTGLDRNLIFSQGYSLSLDPGNHLSTALATNSDP